MAVTPNICVIQVNFANFGKVKKNAPLKRLFWFLSFYGWSVKLLRTSEKLTLLIRLGREILWIIARYHKRLSENFCRKVLQHWSFSKGALLIFLEFFSVSGTLSHCLLVRCKKFWWTIESSITKRCLKLFSASVTFH